MPSIMVTLGQYHDVVLVHSRTVLRSDWYHALHRIEDPMRLNQEDWRFITWGLIIALGLLMAYYSFNYLEAQPQYFILSRRIMGEEL